MSRKSIPGASARACATRVVVEVVAAGRSLDRSLEHAFTGPCSGMRAEQGLTQELAYGAVRYFHQLQGLARHFLARPFKPKDQDLLALICIGLYQLMHTRVPAHAAVSETVAAAEELGKPWAKQVVNAVLRRFQREGAQARAWLDTDPETRFSHPRWMIDQLRADWPGCWEAVLMENNARPPMVLRVNLRRVSREHYLQALRNRGLDAVPTGDAGLMLAHPVPIELLPGFDQGQVSVQDAAAQLAAPLLDAQAGERVLDACAAPGGKLAHILERCPAVEATALDKDGDRLDRVRATLLRLGLRAAIATGDAGNPAAWWDGRAFDRILVDAPCSGSGVIRRHPDIKIHRRPADVAKLGKEQGRILTALWPLLRPGGRLLYATCSIFKHENENRAAAFLAEHPDAHEIALDFGMAGTAGRQILPGTDGMDGFYYACLEKQR